MILQRIRIIVVNAGFEPGTSTPEVWCATNDPPHPQVFYHVQEAFVRCCMVAWSLVASPANSLNFR